MPEQVDTETGEATFRPTNLTEAAERLHKTHGVSVGNDDPMLWTVTLFQMFFEDLDLYLNERDRKVKALLDGASAACTAAVNKELAQLGEKAIAANVRDALSLVSQQSRAMQALEDRLNSHRKTVIRASALTGFLLVCSLVVFFLLLK